MTTTKTRRGAAEPPIGGSRLKYQQVKDHLLRQIADGKLKSGDALLPERVLAKTLRLSVATVRHALTELSEEKVVHRIRGNGTFVSAKPSAPRAQKLDAFALIVPEVGGVLYPSLIKGFIEAAAESHHQVLVCNTHLDTHIQGDMILQVINKDLAGAAIIPTLTPMPAYQFEVLRSHDLPLVFCHRRPEGFNAPLITWPWEEVGRLAGTTLVGRGHRRIAFVASSPRYLVSSAYLEGLRAVLSENGLELPENRIFYHAREDTDDVHRVLIDAMKASDRPTGIFCNDARVAELVFLESMRLGLRVPQDLSIVGFGCTWREGVLSQRLTAVTIDEVDLGRRAALLVGQMQAGQQPLDSHERILVPLGFSEGHSLGPAPGEPLTAKRESVV